MIIAYIFQECSLLRAAEATLDYLELVNGANGGLYRLEL